jgi:hypothetical protein
MLKTHLSPKNKRPSWLIALSLMLLPACTTQTSNACGTLFHYSPEFQQKAAVELDYLQGTGDSPEIVQMMDDYHTTRETIRACK